MFGLYALIALFSFGMIDVIASTSGKSEKMPVDTEFVIFVPSYNNEKYAERNLESVCFQESSKPYTVICVNDCSTDKTGQIMEEFVKKHHLETKVTIIHNEKNMGGLANHYNVFS